MKNKTILVTGGTGIRELEEAFGDGIIQVTESEKIIRNKLRK